MPKTVTVYRCMIVLGNGHTSLCRWYINEIRKDVKVKHGVVGGRANLLRWVHIVDSKSGINNISLTVPC